MRLASPIYEIMPVIYAGIGVLGFVISYVDPIGPRTVIALLIGVIAEVSALTVFLRRQDYRAKQREYTGRRLELPR
jgi:hypothetical protein